MSTVTPPVPIDGELLPDVMTLDEVARRLRLSRHGVANMANRGEIPGALKFGRRWRVSRVAFERALHGSAPGPGPRVDDSVAPPDSVRQE